MKKLTGGCLCGSIKYSSDAEPIMTAICHCDDCQRQAGSAFSIIVGVPKDSLVFEKTDSLQEYAASGKSGREVRRRFCRNCGSPILSLVEAAPDLCLIKAGTLDDKSGLNPTIEFWCGSAQPWLELNSGTKKYNENPG